MEPFWTNRREKRAANNHISAMGSVSAKQDRFVVEAPDQSLPDLAAAADVAVEVTVGQPFAVRETQRLYRLKAARFLAVVAADTDATRSARQASSTSNMRPHSSWKYRARSGCAFVTALPSSCICLFTEPLGLIKRIVELIKPITQFHARDK